MCVRTGARKEKEKPSERSFVHRKCLLLSTVQKKNGTTSCSPAPWGSRQIIRSEKGNPRRHYSTAVKITYLVVGGSCEMGSEVFDIEYAILPPK